VFRLKLANHGVTIIRLAGWDKIEKMNRVAEVFKEHFSKMKDCFTTIRPDRITIRKLNTP